MRGRVQRVRRGTTGFLRQCALVALADDDWAIRASAREIGARQEEGLGCDGKGVDRMGTRVDEAELEARHTGRIGM